MYVQSPITRNGALPTIEDLLTPEQISKVEEQGRGLLRAAEKPEPYGDPDSN